MTRRLDAAVVGLFLLVAVGVACTGAVANSAPSGEAVASTTPLATVTVDSEDASSSGASAPATTARSQSDPADDGTGNATREEVQLVLAVDADRIGGANATTFAVAVPSVGGSTSVEATREGDRFVARFPVTDLVPPGAGDDLQNATVLASHDGSTVVEDAADLRSVAQTGPATFENATLVVPADVRGIDESTVRLRYGPDEEPIAAAVDGTGPNASLRIEPSSLAGVPVGETIVADVESGATQVPGGTVEVDVLDAARRATALRAVGDGAAVVEPLAHPAIGPERIDLTVATGGPRGIYHVAVADEDGLVPVPTVVLGADSHRVTVEGGGETLLADVPASPPGRPTVSLRVENGSLHAPDPERLAGYEVLLVRDENVTAVPIGPSLAAGVPQPLPDAVADPSEDASALLAGDEVGLARVDLDVVRSAGGPSSDPDPPDPDEDAFVGIWLDVGTIVGLLLFAMVGSSLAVGGVYALRRLSPARSATAGGRAVVGHFLFGAIGGVACIVAVQTAIWGPALGSVRLAGVEVGLGALLVGGFHGGLTATGLRMGLGTVGAWPTRRVIDEAAVPVRVRFTDDDGGSLPGEQRVEVRRAEDGGLVETTSLAGTTTEVELLAGEYAIVGETAERETDPVSIAIDEPTTPTPDTRSVHLTVGRPGLQVEVTDAQTGESVPTGRVTVTTDRQETRAADVEDGTVTTTLPLATGTVTAVVSAEGYDDATVETPIEEELTTVDVGLEPASGTLVVSALVGGEPIEDATVDIEPADVEPDDAAAVDGTAAGDAVGKADLAPPDAASTESGASVRHGDPDVDAPAGSPSGSPGSPGPTDSPDSPDSPGSTAEIGVRTAEVTTDGEGTATATLPAGHYRASLDLDGPNADLFAVRDGLGTVEPDAETAVSVYGRFDWEPDQSVRRRAAGLRNTIQSVAEEATADPTIPLYFAGATEALLGCVDALEATGHQFATSSQDPDAVAAATVAAAEAALEAVGQAMQSESVRPTLARGGDSVRVSPDLDADPADLLDYLERDLAIASVEARANEVERVVEAEAARRGSVAPARAVVERAVELVPNGDASTRASAVEFAAILLLDAVEQCFEHPPIRSRLDGES